MQNIAQSRPRVAGDGQLKGDPELLPQHRQLVQQVVLADADLLIILINVNLEILNNSYPQKSGHRILIKTRGICLEPFPDTYISRVIVL